MNISELRLKHPVFEFKSFSWEIADTLSGGLDVVFEYTLDPLPPFQHTLFIEEIDEGHIGILGSEQLEKYLLLIGMIEGLSYWKAAASPTYKVSAGPVSPAQLSWLEKLLKKGMGEYFYVNDIDFTRPDFIEMVASAPDNGNAPKLLPPEENKPTKYLIPIGGGKDSVVTLLALLDQFGSEAKDKLGTVMIHPNQSQFDTVQGADLPNFVVKRHLDPLLFELNEQGYLNGHTPFSAMAAAATTLVAELNGYTHVLTSNERSSNEGSVWYRGEYVNHHYSKTLELENDFREYVDRYLVHAPHYSSYLRPLYELQIASLFAKLTALPQWQHLRRAFRSCNRGKKTNSWCGNCSKCLFAFVILSPFIELEELISIFGRNVLDNPDLVTAALELVGGTPAKPLECVGTLAESKVAFGVLLEKYHGQDLPVVLAAVKPYLAFPQEMNTKAMKELLWSWDEANNIPPELGSPLQARLHSLLSTTPSPWSFAPPSLNHLNDDHPLIIAGFGREGQSTYHYVRAVLPPTTRLAVIDDKYFNDLPESYQRLLKTDSHCTYFQTSELGWKHLDHPIVFKTPGLPLHHPVVKYIEEKGWKVLSNTKLFFEVTHAWMNAMNQPYKTVGVTGTKGKSTTTSLIHHILKTAKLPAFLGGNIGVPPLDLLESVYKTLANDNSSSETLYFVLEMSAHQLSDLDISPNIAVVQNIVPEHLDYYPDFETYKTAKSGIAKYQTPADIILFNPSLEEPTAIARLSAAHPLPFGVPRSSVWVENDHIITPSGTVMSVAEVTLLGAFNLANVLPSVALANHLGISLDVIKQGITTFRPLPHRLEKVREHNGVLYVNDSLSTIPEAAQNAIASLAPRSIILLAGGYDRHLSFAKFAEFLTHSTVKKLILFLPTGAYILEELHKLGPSVSSELINSAVVVRTMADAVTLAHQSAEPGDVILLSPASASFGEFKDYKDRGDQFALLCRNLQ